MKITANQIYRDPQHEYTRKLLSSFPSLRGDRGDFVRTGRQPIAATLGSASREGGAA